jgi:hypothetical protein
VLVKKGKWVVALAFAGLLTAAPAASADDTHSAAGFKYVQKDLIISGSLNTIKTVTANCPAGTHVIAGGYLTSGDNGEAFLLADQPKDRPDADHKPDDAWTVTFRKYTNENLSVSAEAVCAPLKPKYRGHTIDVDPNSQKNVSQLCKSGESALDAGYGAGGEEVHLNAAYPNGSEFEMYVDNYESTVTPTYAVAVCLKTKTKTASQPSSLVPHDQSYKSVTCSGTSDKWLVVSGGQSNSAPYGNVSQTADDQFGAGDYFMQVDNYNQTTTYSGNTYALCMKKLR